MQVLDIMRLVLTRRDFWKTVPFAQFFARPKFCAPKSFSTLYFHLSRVFTQPTIFKVTILHIIP